LRHQTSTTKLHYLQSSAFSKAPIKTERQNECRTGESNFEYHGLKRDNMIKHVMIMTAIPEAVTIMKSFIGTSYCWVRLGSSTWNVLWLWNTNKERLQKQVQKAT